MLSPLHHGFVTGLGSTPQPFHHEHWQMPLLLQRQSRHELPIRAVAPSEQNHDLAFDDVLQQFHVFAEVDSPYRQLQISEFDCQD